MALIPVHGETPDGSWSARAEEGERYDRYDWERARGPITAFGESRTLREWAKDPRCKVGRETLRTRLALGWDCEDAITRERHDKPALEYTYQGRTLTLRGWAKQSGIKYHTLYNRLTKSGMAFEEALLKGADGPDFTLPVTAFSETKPLSHWAVDPRAGCALATMRRRLAQGWDPEQAITEEPATRTRLGTGAPHRAFGLRMGLEDWARHSQIPVGAIRHHLDYHGQPLEEALRSLGWTPHPGTGEPHDLIEIPAAALQAGDRILGITPRDGQDALLTVRRTPSDTPSPPDDATATTPHRTPRHAQPPRRSTAAEPAHSPPPIPTAPPVPSRSAARR